MLVPTWFRKWLAVFRGEVSAVLILLSVGLGFWFGLTPGWYGLHIGLLVVVLLLNVHFGLFLLFAGLGKALCYAAAPILYHVGVWVQDALSPLLRLLAAIPVVGVTDFSRYAVAGAVLLGPVIGLACGLLLAWAVQSFRRKWLAMEEGSERLKTWRANRWVRLLDRLLLGKAAHDVRAVLTRKPKIVRKAGLVVAALLVVLVGIAVALVQDEALTSYAAHTLTKLNGAQVDLERAGVGLLSGRVSVTGLQVTDPDKPANNLVAVDQITADASLYHLLCGKVVMDDIVLSNVEFDAARDKPGEVSAPSAEPSPQPQPFEPAAFGLSDVDVNKLETYLQKSKAVREWLAKVRKWLPDAESKAPQPPPTVPHRYLAYLTASAPRTPTPRMVARRVVLDQVLLPVEQIGRSRIVCINLSDAPLAAGLPVTIHVKSVNLPTEITVVAHYESPKRGAQVSATFADIALNTLQSELSRHNPLAFTGGSASGSIEGQATRDLIDLAISVKTQDMQADWTGDGAFGLDPQVTREAIKVLSRMETTLRLVGPITEPRLVFDHAAMREQFKNALVQAGKAELARRVDQVLAEQLPAGVPAPSKVLESPAEAVGAGLKALLTTKPADKQPANKKKDNQRNLLSGLKDALKKPQK
jgi:uncharacterized protein (TIGR03546 family)